MSGLPSFFQNSGTTVLDELTGELEAPLEDDRLAGDELDGLIGDADNGEDTEVADQETFGEAFGDLKPSALPDFFAPPKMEDLRLDGTPSTVPLVFGNTPLKMPPPPGMGQLTPARAAPSTPSAPPGFGPTAGTPFRTASGMMPVPPNTVPVFASPPRTVTVGMYTASPQPPPLPVGPLGPVPIAPMLTIPRAPAAPMQHAAPVVAIAPALAPRPDFGRGQYMSASDCRYIASKVLQPLESSDIYADDFYFLQFNLKKNLRARDEALKAGRAPPPHMLLPPPTWKDMKERIRTQVASSKQFFEGQVKQWEEKEQVLGHRIRSDVTRPKALLTMPSLQDLDFDLDNEDETEFKTPFSTRLWTTRQSVQRGYEALFTVQELQNLAIHPMLCTNQLAMEEIRKEMEVAVDLLSESLGILNKRHAESAPGDAACNLDARHVSAIMQTVMGRKLLCRGLKLLSSAQRWALVPVVLARALMSPPTAAQFVGQAALNEALAVERKLLQTVRDFIQYSYQLHLQGNDLLQSNTSVKDLLSNLRQCVKNVIVTHMEKKKQLRETLLSEKARAEVMHVIVQVGDDISMETDTQLAEEWTQTKEAFMSLLDD